jgi:hypothetical protein
MNHEGDQRANNEHMDHHIGDVKDQEADNPDEQQ